MYVEPNTTIKLLFGVPLNPTYEGTLTFDSREEQYDYFNSKNPITLTQYSYQRYEDGVICVELPISRLYTCDYMMFQNYQYNEDKWFYAFVTNVEYVSETTTKVFYTIDVMQTWLLGQDWEFDNCFIDREHVSDDTIGTNILPEPFECGDFVLQKQNRLETYTGYGMIIAGFCRIGIENNQQTHLIPNEPQCELVAFGNTMDESPVSVIEKTMYNQVYNYMPFTTASDREKALHVLKSLLEGNFWNSFNNLVTSIYIVPNNYVGEIKYINRRAIQVGSTSPASISDIICDGFGTYDSYFSINTSDYTPVCNKLYTEQFRTIKITGMNGCDYVIPQDSVSITQSEDEYGVMQRYVSYRIKGGVYSGCGYRFTPAMKNGTYARACSLDTGAIVENPFTASEKTSMMGNALLSMLTSVIRGFTPAKEGTKVSSTDRYRKESYRKYKGDEDFSPTGYVTSERVRTRKSQSSPAHMEFPLAKWIDIFSTAGVGKSMSDVPSIGSTVIDNINGYYTFGYEIYTPNTKDIISLDNYLNTFGYASNRIGKPNYNTRKKWNYVKTKLCNLKDSRCPTETLVAIKGIINNGIMFWHGEENVYNYVLPNGKPNPNEVNNV